MNLFMMCRELNRAALSEMPPGYRVRRIRPNETGVWKRLQFDDDETALRNAAYMDDWYRRVYSPKREKFIESCLMVRDKTEKPVATCFLWYAYGLIPTVHWFKVTKKYEGIGIGRALLTRVMKDAEQYPVYLHTQPESFRAIKLYSDFGFALLTDAIIGSRQNDLKQALPYLQEHMPAAEYQKLQFAAAPEELLRITAENPTEEF